jgi:hypothetical protein
MGKHRDAIVDALQEAMYDCSAVVVANLANAINEFRHEDRRAFERCMQHPMLADILHCIEGAHEFNTLMGAEDTVQHNEAAIAIALTTAVARAHKA